MREGEGVGREEEGRSRKGRGKGEDGREGKKQGRKKGKEGAEGKGKEEGGRVTIAREYMEQRESLLQKPG